MIDSVWNWFLHSQESVSPYGVQKPFVTGLVTTNWMSFWSGDRINANIVIIVIEDIKEKEHTNIEIINAVDLIRFFVKMNWEKDQCVMQQCY